MAVTETAVLESAPSNAELPSKIAELAAEVGACQSCGVWLILVFSGRETVYSPSESALEPYSAA